MPIDTGRLSTLAEKVPATSLVTLVGQGPLIIPLTRLLTQNQQITLSHYTTIDALQHAPEATQSHLVIAISSCWNPSFDESIQRWCWEHRLAFLRVGTWQREAVIGPLTHPGTPGCAICAEWRRSRALVTDHKNERLFLTWCKNEAHLAQRATNPWITTPALNLIAMFAAKEIEAYLACLQEDLPAHIRTVRFLQLRTLISNCSTFLPDPDCHVCAQPTEDQADDATLQLVPRPRSNQSYRSRNLSLVLPALEHDYVDTRLGIQLASASFLHSDTTRFASATASYYEDAPFDLPIHCGGYTPSFRASRATAIVEALERYSSMRPRGKRTIVHGSYRQLHHEAIDPTRYGLYSPEQYADLNQRYPASFCVPYHENLEFPWVWGYSLREQRPVLVPEQIAYFALPEPGSPSPRFLLESSSGCAVGSSLEEAILYGLFEVIERDAFLLAWYGRLPLPRIDPRSTSNDNLKLVIERIERVNTITLHTFDATTEFGLPVVVSVGVNRADEMPKTVYAAAAHWFSEEALSKACYETAINYLTNKRRGPEDLERGKKMFANPFLITSIDDHVLTGAMPQAHEWSRFLFQDQPLQSLQERFPSQSILSSSTDLTQDLLNISQRVLQRGYDIIVIDQTSPDLSLHNLHCVRVLVPGLLPLSFGHALRRTHGLERVYTMPAQLGYTNRILNASDLNPHPHAFP